MQQLLYAEEVRSIKEVEIPETEVKDAELKLARQLIDAQTSDKFDPKQYTDTVAERIRAAIQKKVEGQEISLADEPEVGAQVIDLMAALRASLDKKPAAPSESAGRVRDRGAQAAQAARRPQRPRPRRRK
jgi:DNA end-binding protein Ku